MKIQRKINNQLKYLATHFPVVVVGGARQVGKSTLLKEFATASKNTGKQINYVTLVLSLYSMSRAEILSSDETPFLPSNEFLQAKTAETITSIFDKIYRGAMPQLVVDSGLSPEDFFNEYVQTYIERDIRDFLEISNETKFYKFISCVAARTGQELNLSDLAKDTSIDPKTADKWLSLLVTSGIVFLLQPYSGNVIKRIIKRPKLYFMDTGLVCYLSRWNNPRALEISAMAGAMFETYVISEIVKTYTNKGIDVRSRFFYYRDSNKKEIDLLIIQNGTIYPIEIKKSSDPGKDAVKNFSVLGSFPEVVGEGAVICLASMIFPLDSKNKIIPIAAI